MDILFNVMTPLGKKIRTTDKYWDEIVTYKHPTLAGKLREVELTLVDPDTVRISKTDDQVFLYYRQTGKYLLCAVVKQLNGDGFLVTAYFTPKEKEGIILWQRKK